MYMRRARTPLELLLGMPSEAAYETEDAYVSVVIKHMQHTYSLVREQFQVSYDRAKRRYDERAKTTEFKEGEFVVALHSKTEESPQPEVVVS